MRRGIATAVAVALAVVLGLLLLWPDGEVVRRVVLEVYLFFYKRGVPIWVTPEWYAAALNVLAFVPLGWLAVGLLRMRVSGAVLLLMAGSVLVELVQAAPGLSRDPSALDVLCNASGALLGALAARSVLGPLARRSSGAGGRADQDPRSHEGVHEVEDFGRDHLG